MSSGGDLGSLGSLAALFAEPRIYSINFAAAGVNIEAFNRYLTDSKDIEGFWNYIDCVYFVKSRLTAKELALKISPFFNHETFIVAETNPKNVDGMMPPVSWEWFYRTTPNSLAPLRPPPPAPKQRP